MRTKKFFPFKIEQDDSESMHFYSLQKRLHQIELKRNLLMPN